MDKVMAHIPDDWRTGFYAAVGEWLGISGVWKVEEHTDVVPGYSVADDEVEVSLIVHYVNDRGDHVTKKVWTNLTEVIQAIAPPVAPPEPPPPCRASLSNAVLELNGCRCPDHAFTHGRHR